MIYETQDMRTAENLLSVYDVDYVYVGPRERGVYGDGELGKFDAFMDRVYDEGTVVIYRVRGAGR